jgi:hypothetical protein
LSETINSNINNIIILQEKVDKTKIELSGDIKNSNKENNSKYLKT